MRANPKTNFLVATRTNLFRGWGAATLLSLMPVCSDGASVADLDESIRQVRMGTLVVKAAPGVEVRVEQLRHEFWFGAALASQVFSVRMNPDDREKYRAAFLTNFNAAVTENALKWHSMESRRGSVDYATVDAILAWTGQHQIPLRGHNVFPAWLIDSSSPHRLWFCRVQGFDSRGTRRDGLLHESVE